MKDLLENINTFCENSQNIEEITDSNHKMMLDEQKPYKDKIEELENFYKNKTEEETKRQCEENEAIKDDILANYNQYLQAILNKRCAGKYFSDGKSFAYYIKSVKLGYEICNYNILVSGEGEVMYINPKCFRDALPSVITGSYETNDRRVEFKLNIDERYNYLPKLIAVTGTCGKLKDSEKIVLLKYLSNEENAVFEGGYKEISKEEFNELERKQREVLNGLLSNEATLDSGEIIKAGDFIRHMSIRSRSRAIEEHDVLYVDDKYAYIDLYFDKFYGRVKLEKVFNKITDEKTH